MLIVLLSLTVGGEIIALWVKPMISRIVFPIQPLVCIIPQSLIIVKFKYSSFCTQEQLDGFLTLMGLSGLIYCYV